MSSIKLGSNLGKLLLGCAEIFVAVASQYFKTLFILISKFLGKNKLLLLNLNKKDIPLIVFTLRVNQNLTLDLTNYVKKNSVQFTACIMKL